MQQVTSTPTLAPRQQPRHTHIPEDDLLPHVEDDIKVNAIRNGRLIEIPWNSLTEAERRAANVATFSPCEWS